MKPCIWFLAAGAMFACMAATSTLAGESSKPTETLHVPPYPAVPPWKKLSDQRDARQLMIEWIPVDQDESHIRDILTEQAFYQLRGEPPGEILKRIMALTTNACRDVKVNGPVNGNEEGYAVAYAQIYCVGQKGADADVDILAKSIGGKEAVYVVQREFRRPAKPGAVAGVMEFPKGGQQQAVDKLNAMKAASDFLAQSVYLCPKGGAVGRCTR